MNQQAVLNEKKVLCEYGDCCERAYVVRPFALFHPRDRKVKVEGKKNLVSGGAILVLCAAQSDADTCSALLASVRSTGGMMPMERIAGDYYASVEAHLAGGRQMIFCPELLTRQHTIAQEEAYALAAHAGVPVVPILLYAEDGKDVLSVQKPVYPCADLSERENASYMAYVARMENQTAYRAQAKAN